METRPVNQETVLIISDDAEFPRVIMSRWQAERTVPAFTLLTGELWNGAKAAAFHLAVVGPLFKNRTSTVLEKLDSAGAPAVFVTTDGKAIRAARASYPRVLALPQHDGWLDAVVLVSSEILRRVEATARACRAEQAAVAREREATLGRYMVEMRHTFNNALTSVLGNSELLLLEPGSLSAQARDQVDTIHTMALRLREVMQRFCSLENEMRFSEKASHAETSEIATALVSGT
jgi:signal transduction histidine kinase